MSVSPDEGMMLLQQEMHRQDISAPAVVPPAAGAEIGGELGIMVRLAAAIEDNTATMRAIGRANQRIWEQCHVITIPGGQLAAAGTLDDPDRFGPRPGFAWQVLGVMLQLGSGATGWSVYEDSPLGPLNIQFSQTVSGRWEPDDFFLLPGSRLVYTSTGGGLTVGNGKAIEIGLDALPGYLGLKLTGRL